MGSILVAILISSLATATITVALGGLIMAQFEDVKALIAAINEATNVLAAKLQALIDQINAGGMTAGQEAEIVADLESVKSALQALGADPESPV